MSLICVLITAKIVPNGFHGDLDALRDRHAQTRTKTVRIRTEVCQWFDSYLLAVFVVDLIITRSVICPYNMYSVT